MPDVTRAGAPAPSWTSLPAPGAIGWCGLIARQITFHLTVAGISFSLSAVSSLWKSKDAAGVEPAKSAGER